MLFLPTILDEARSSPSTSAAKFLELFDAGLSNCNEHLVRPNERKDNHNVVMFSSFIAEQSERLFIHLLLTLGSFTTELDLFRRSNDMRVCLPSAGFDTNSVQSTLIKITKRFIIEQAQFIPGSTRTFDRNVIACYKLVRGFTL